MTSPQETGSSDWHVVIRVGVRGAIVGLASVLVVSATVLGANVATADSIKHESYQRATQAEACSSRQGETVWQASWGSDSSWKPTWEQWANGGKGGWTCTRAITWARTPVAGGTSARTYALGETGPGGGLVFLISGGLTYEMAPKTWGANESTGIAWCSNTSSDITGAVGTAVGTGSANTTAMLSFPCTSGAAVSARAYAGGGLTDWFLPSKDELNAMCNYSRNPSSPALPSVGCSGVQNGTFAAGTYGFASGDYWSSSQFNARSAWFQYLDDGDRYDVYKTSSRRVRPVRAF
jgi:hypothetical protein